MGASDPVGAGYVASLPRPGGNITGFTLYEPTLAGKWLGVLKEVTPGLARVGLLINPDTAVLRGTFYTQAFESAASTLGIEPVMAKVFTASDIQATIQSLAQQPGSGLIVAPDTFSEVNGDLIVTLAAQYRVPAVYAISRYAKGRADVLRRIPMRSSGRQPISIAFSKAKSPPICRSRRRSNSISSST